MARAKQLVGIWWNVLYESRHKPKGAVAIADRVEELVKHYDPDWICLQEAYRYDRHGSDGDVTALIKQRTGMNAFFTPNVNYPLKHESSDDTHPYADGLAFFSKWPILDTHEVVLGIVENSEGGNNTRYLLETKLHTDAGTVIVGNTHWTWMSYRNFKPRKKQMIVFANHIAHRTTDHPYVIGGDFNTFPWHPIIRKLRQKLILQTGTYLRPTWKLYGHSLSPFRSAIDYVGTFKDSIIRISKLELLAAKPSDHSPLLATFTIEQ